MLCEQRLRDIDWIGVVLWIFRAVIIIAMIWGTAATLLDKENPLSLNEFLGYLVDGISQGSLYALIALGYTLVYGILFMINFAHGEFFMSGAMTATIFVAIPLSESGFLDAYPVPGTHHLRSGGGGHLGWRRPPDRADRLPAAAQGAPPGPPDHGHRRLFLLAVLLPGPVWRSDHGLSPD